MKVVKSLVMAIIVVLVVSGTVATAAPLKIGITWPGKSGLATRIVEAFREKITELVPDVEIDLQSAPDVEAMGEVIARFEREKDGMLVMRESGARWLITHPPAIPTFIGANRPDKLGVVKNMEAPDGNITGVSYYIPLEKKFDIFQALVPNLDAVLLLLEQGHSTTESDRAETQAICDQRGITYYEKVCATRADSIAAVEAYRDKVTTVIIGNNALNADNAKNILNAAGDVPVLAYAADAVNAGALGGFTFDITILGHLLAESVMEVLVNGKAIHEVPIKMDPDPTFVLNVSTAEKLGIEIPYNILRAATIIE